MIGKRSRGIQKCEAPIQALLEMTMNRPSLGESRTCVRSRTGEELGSIMDAL